MNNGKINPLNINPFTQTWIESNIPYDQYASTSSTDNSLDIYKGLGDINYNYRYLFFRSQDTYNYFMSQASMRLMSTEITRKLTGVHPEGKNIVVPDEMIRSVADSMYENNRMDIKALQEMTINYIVNTIRTEYDVINNNNKLSIWVTKYDIDSGLQRTNGIKLNRKQRNSYYYWKY
jgi:hypothetical protein